MEAVNSDRFTSPANCEQ